MKRLLSALACSTLLTTAAAADPAIWHVSDEDSDIYLFGSIHILQPTTQWRTALLDQVLSGADTYYYELPMTAEAQAASQSLIPQYGLMPTGQRFTTSLTPEQLAQLDRICAQFGLPRVNLEPLQPWLVAVTLSVMAMQAQGYSPAAGVDATLAGETDDASERFFETYEQQFGFFASMPLDSQIDFLAVSMDQIENEPDMLGNMVAAWESGNVEGLAAVFHEGMKETDEALYETLITNRNLAWTAEIEEMMAGSGQTVIIVGAGHLVGSDGVPTLLETRGYTVERVQ